MENQKETDSVVDVYSAALHSGGVEELQSSVHLAADIQTQT